MSKSIWARKLGDRLVRKVDDWSSSPSDSWWTKWFWGIIVPLLILGYGLHTIINKAGVLPGYRGSRLGLHGTDAVLFGWALVCLALFLHTDHFWGNTQALFQLHEAGKAVTLLGFCIVSYSSTRSAAERNWRLIIAW
ncbi:MAG: hypothetical protein ACOYD3_13065 [Kiritimatiellia bacterium]|jgi:hypothetical protein